MYCSGPSRQVKPHAKRGIESQKMVCYPSSRQLKKQKFFLPGVVPGSFYAASSRCFS